APDAPGGEEAGFDSGPDAFAAAVVGEPGRIADENESFAADDPAAVGLYEIRMARHLFLRRASDAAPGLEVREEIVDAVREAIAAALACAGATARAHAAPDVYVA